jgi:hypothetical protein
MGAVGRVAAHVRQHVANVWNDVAWPVLAGAVAAVGLLGLWHAYGLLGVTLIPTALWVFATVTVYGVLSESGVGPGRAVRIARNGTLVVVVLMGWLLLFERVGWLPVAAIAATSPPAIERVARTCRRRWSELTQSGTAAVTPDQAAVDRTFDQIVADLESDPSWRSEDH